MDTLTRMFYDGHGWDIVTTLLVSIAFYLIGALFIGRIVNRIVQARGRNWHRKDVEKREKTLTHMFAILWRVVVITGAAFALFQIIFPGVSLAPLFASAGILGVAFGFGAQSLVRDFLSGIFIISENQYRVGDVIDIQGSAGTVERVGARSTVLRDADGNVHYFPNGTIQHVINKTMGYSIARFYIGVASSSDLDEVIELINKTGASLAAEDKWKTKIITAPSFDSVSDFTANDITLLVSGKTQPSDQWSVVSEMRQRLFFEFENKKIKLSGTAPTTNSTAKK